MAWYSPDQWDRLRAVAADKEKLEQPYAEWAAGAGKGLAELNQAGAIVEKVTVDVNELEQWCRNKNLAIDAGARAQFAAERLRRASEKNK